MVSSLARLKKEADCSLRRRTSTRLALALTCVLPRRWMRLLRWINRTFSRSLWRLAGAKDRFFFLFFFFWIVPVFFEFVRRTNARRSNASINFLSSFTYHNGVNGPRFGAWHFAAALDPTNWTFAENHTYVVGDNGVTKVVNFRSWPYFMAILDARGGEICCFLIFLLFTFCFIWIRKNRRRSIHISIDELRSSERSRWQKLLAFNWSANWRAELAAQMGLGQRRWYFDAKERICCGHWQSLLQVILLLF